MMFYAGILCNMYARPFMQPLTLLMQLCLCGQDPDAKTSRQINSISRILFKLFYCLDFIPAVFHILQKMYSFTSLFFCFQSFTFLCLQTVKEMQIQILRSIQQSTLAPPSVRRSTHIWPVMLEQLCVNSLFSRICPSLSQDESNKQSCKHQPGHNTKCLVKHFFC